MHNRLLQGELEAFCKMVVSHPKRKKEKKKATRWNQRNFITEVLIPSLFVRKSGVENRPVFPTLATGTQIP